jgi:hypothetical protein
MARESYESGMLDITAPANVEVEIKGDGNVIWVNVDGVCRFRACRIGALRIRDYRPNYYDDAEVPR